MENERQYNVQAARTKVQSEFSENRQWCGSLSSSMDHALHLARVRGTAKPERRAGAKCTGAQHVSVCSATQFVSSSLWHHRLQPTRLLCLWGFSRQEYWSWFPCPPPGDLPNTGIKPRSLHCRQILYYLSHWGCPRKLGWVAYPFSRGSSWPMKQTWHLLHCRPDSLSAELPGKPGAQHTWQLNQKSRFGSSFRCYQCGRKKKSDFIQRLVLGLVVLN